LDIDPIDTPLGKRLATRQAEALALWQVARTRMPWAQYIDDASWNEFLDLTARPLTWKLWEMAIEEAAR
jgi:hypothetical protein